MAKSDKTIIPKELQGYKRKIKKMDFEARVKAYFDCIPFEDPLATTKRKLIYETFNEAENYTFLKDYRPILQTIEKQGDRIRAIHRSILLYSVYLEMGLREEGIIRYTADFLNNLWPDPEELKEGKAIQRVGNLLKTYRKVIVTGPSPDIRFNEDTNKYEVIENAEANKTLIRALTSLRGLLALIKTDLEALKEFLAWIGHADIMPAEFRNMENSLQERYKKIDFTEKNSREKELFPLFHSRTNIEIEFYSIDYKEIPCNEKRLGANNFWANYYRKLFHNDI